MSKEQNTYDIENVLNSLKIKYKKENDLYIDNESKIAILYCKLYNNCESKVGKNYHIDLLNKFKNKGYKLITVFEDEWLNKNDIIQSKIEYIFNKFNGDKIYARKCEIKEIEPKEAKIFVEKYHIQGYSPCTIKLGAFYNNDLVAVMTFSKPSISKGRKDQNTKGIWELNRFCSSCNVIGIASKLLSFFKKNYNWVQIYTFADKRYSTGNLYEKLNFVKVSETKPNYFYFNSPNEKKHRFNFRKNVLHKKLDTFNPDKTEYQNMLENNYNRIWDCGNIKFEMNNDKGLNDYKKRRF